MRSSLSRLLAALALTCTMPAWAGKAATPLGWSGEVGIGYMEKSGNSRSTSFNGKSKAIREGEQWRNTYKLEGTIDNRLDSWKGSDRLFSVQVSEGGSFVPVLVPASLDANIQRGQRYVFKVRVLETGVLEVLQLLKA